MPFLQKGSCAISRCLTDLTLTIVDKILNLDLVSR